MASATQQNGAMAGQLRSPGVPSLAKRALLNPSGHSCFSVEASSYGILLKETPSPKKAFLPSQCLVKTYARCFPLHDQVIVALHRG
jgi:hypothetical protein